MSDDPRYPYTYACDYVRELAGRQENGLSMKLGRGDASLIRKGFATALGMDDHALALVLADAFLRDNSTGEGPVRATDVPSGT